MKSFLVIATVTTALVGLTFGEQQNGLLAKVNHPGFSSFIREWPMILRDSPDHIESICPGIKQKLVAALKSTPECPATLKNVTICSAVRNYLKPCTAPLVKVLEECIPEKSRGLPKLAVKSIESLFRYVCGLDGEHLIEITNSCYYRNEFDMAKVQEAVDIDRCREASSADIFRTKSDPPSASDVCRVYGADLKKCVLAMMKSACSDENEITREVWAGLIDSIMAPCNDLEKEDKKN